MKKIAGLEIILLIDDDEATNYYNKYIIKNLNLDLEVHTVNSGSEAIDFLRCEGKYSNNDCFPQPGLIFLDINMPGMNGWEFLDEYEKLSSEKKGKYVLAMLTTSLNPDDRKKAEQYDLVKNLLHKPLEEGKVLKFIDVSFPA